MTETINSANAAASTLFLGHNGEWWDFWLIMSVLFVALAGAGVTVTTAGSIVSHKREAAAATKELERYKLDTGKQIADATARQKEAELQLHQLQFPRSLNFEKFKEEIADIPPQNFEILYDSGTSDAQGLAVTVWITLRQLGWKTTQKLPAPLSPKMGPSELRDIWPMLPLTQQSGGGPWGLSVVTKGPMPAPNIKTPAHLLVTALSRSLIGPPVMTTEGTDSTMPLEEIRLIVGPKSP
jgi:hypothetical protein